MEMKKYFIGLARNKARRDFEKNPKDFLNGNIIGYEKQRLELTDTYMADAYDEERQKIIKECENG